MPAPLTPNLTAAQQVQATQGLNENFDTHEVTALLKLASVAAGSGTSNVPAATTATRGTVLQAAAVPNLTDSSGGTSGGNTVPSVPAATAATSDTTAASLTSTNAAITALKNDVATLAAKVNALLAASRTAGQLS